MKGSGSGLPRSPGTRAESSKTSLLLGSSSLLTIKEKGGYTSFSMNHYMLTWHLGFLRFNSSWFQGPGSSSRLPKSKH